MATVLKFFSQAFPSAPLYTEKNVPSLAGKVSTYQSI
jgi:hypothetical protein